MTADCYNDAERATAFYTVFTEEATFRAVASLLGTTVIETDIGHDGVSLAARCASGGTERWLALVDLELPEETVAAWLHAAYWRDSGLTPYASAMPVDWKPDWL